MLRIISLNIIGFLSIFFVLILIFDFFVYLNKPDLIMSFSHFYRIDENIQKTRNFPKGYFIKDEYRGFDIRSSAKPINLRVPPEIGYSYPIFSNSDGCFDEEIPQNNSDQKIVYMAGDSFTWAYVPYEKKFSTIYDKLNTNHIVLNCGVPHTGQLHQFSKFKDIYDDYKNITTVIVNIVANDVDNDFFYPHTTVIEGELVEDSFWCIEKDKIKKIKQNKKEFDQEKFFSYFLSPILKYSASSNIAYFSIRKIAKYLMYDTSASMYINCPNLSPNVYGYKNWSYSLQDEFASPNINAIEKWIEHSRINEYRLIFSAIPHKDKNVEHFTDLELKLNELNAEFYNFYDYMINKEYPKKTLYWDNDGHFNIKGNIEYATYLFEKIN